MLGKFITNFDVWDEVEMQKQKEHIQAEEVFTVFKAVNGFYAKTPVGEIVVGKTLSEVWTEVVVLLNDQQMRR